MSGRALRGYRPFVVLEVVGRIVALNCFDRFGFADASKLSSFFFGVDSTDVDLVRSPSDRKPLDFFLSDAHEIQQNRSKACVTILCVNGQKAEGLRWMCCRYTHWLRTTELSGSQVRFTENFITDVKRCRWYIHCKICKEEPREATKLSEVHCLFRESDPPENQGFRPRLQAVVDGDD